MPSKYTKCVCGHLVYKHSDAGCSACQCNGYKPSVMIAADGEPFGRIERRLRDVLRKQGREFCPYCKKQIAMSDVHLVVSRNRLFDTHQIVCQNCFTDILEIRTYGDIEPNINTFIEALSKIKM